LQNEDDGSQKEKGKNTPTQFAVTGFFHKYILQQVQAKRNLAADTNSLSNK
jgi:hypothetical protein